MAGGTTSVGSVSFDLSLNTASLTQAVNDASNNIRTQLTNAFTAATAGCESSIRGIGNSIAQVSGSIQGEMSHITQSMEDSFRSTSSQIAADLQSSFSQTSQNMTDTLTSSASQASSNVQGSMSQLSGGVAHAVGSATAQLGNAADGAKEKISSLGSAVKKLGALILSAFAVKQITAFSKSCVEAAAQVKALNAQLEQTFTTLEGDARTAIQSVADESGILATRLQSTGTGIYAFAKASGMDSVTALNMMQEALRVTADSAAYYDRSIENTAESLRSFLKGNYANDAALGISCTETTRNTAANKLYGKSFKDLSEAQKQLTLLQMVKDANELSGAMGQAAREADGWENVTGNLKEAWKQFKAAIGKPLLQALIPIIKNITSAIQTLTAAASDAAKTLAELFGWDLGDAESTGGAIADIAGDTADSVSDAEEQAQEDIENTVKAQQKAQSRLADFDNLNVLNQDNSSDESSDLPQENVDGKSIEQAQNALNKLQKSVEAFNTATLADKLKQTLSSVLPLVNSVKDNCKVTLETAWQSIEKYVSRYGGTISDYGKYIKKHLQNTARQTSSGVANILNEAAKSQKRNQEELSDSWASLIGGASIFSLSFADVFTEGLDISSRNFQQWTEDNSSLIGEFFDGVNTNIINFNETLGSILGDAGSTLTQWWDETGSQAFSRFTQAILDVQSVLLDFWNSYISPFVDYIINSVQELWDNHLSGLWNGILELVSSVWDCISALWNNLLRPVYDTFLKRIMTGILGALKSIWDIVSDVVGAIIDIVKGLIRSLQGILDFITGVFTGDIEKCVKGFAEFVQGIAIMIWGAIKGVINLVIDALNTVWSAIYGVLKSIVDGVGDFVSMIGGLFGKDWGFSLPDEVPRIPRLATGGIVKAPTIAMVGDNPNARNDPEIISPLSKLQGMINNDDNESTIVLQQILMYVKKLYEYEKNGGGDVNITAELDGDVVFRNMVKRGKNYERRHGRKVMS